MDIKKIGKFLEENNQPKFRLGQIQKAVFQDGISSFSEITTIPKNLRELLSNPIAKLNVLSFEVEKVLEAGDGQSVKAALKLNDGNIIETVLISPKPDVWSACISCQVGCQMNCQFCATGKMGFKRNLTAEEITDQVLFWRQYLKKSEIRISKSETNKKSEIQNSKSRVSNLGFRNYDVKNVVYMGMGEPFLNWENVSESLKNLTDPKMFGFGSRSISVSTSGVPEGIEKMAEDFPQVNLALSLHFADDQKRSEIMPINRKNNLEALKKSLQNYFLKTKRKVFLEYVMLEKINDSREDADKLVKFVKSIGKLQLLHVNLIRYNAPNVIPTEVEESNLKKVDPSASLRSAQDDIFFKSSSKERTVDFKNYLLRNNIPVTIRKSLGEEIQGACGQLSGK